MLTYFQLGYLYGASLINWNIPVEMDNWALTLAQEEYREFIRGMGAAL